MADKKDNSRQYTYEQYTVMLDGQPVVVKKARSLKDAIAQAKRQVKAKAEPTSEEEQPAAEQDEVGDGR